MEAVARQFATDRDVLVIRNGWFSYRWSQIFEAGGIPGRGNRAEGAARRATTRRRRSRPRRSTRWSRRSVAKRPAVVFAPHVETSAGIILPDDYIRAVAEAVHEVGGLFVLDCIASGCVWVDMKATGRRRADLGAAEGLVGLAVGGARDAVGGGARRGSRKRAVDQLRRRSGQVAVDHGGLRGRRPRLPRDDAHRRAARLPRHDGRDEGVRVGAAARGPVGAGRPGARVCWRERGIRSVAAEGFGAPGVVVSYTDDPAIQSGKPFAEAGVQIAAGVPLHVRRGRGLPDLPHRALRARQACRRGRERRAAARGAGSGDRARERAPSAAPVPRA